MRLKPKSSVKNPRALLYRRYTDIANATTTKAFYKTTIDNKFWVFNITDFIEVPAETVSSISDKTIVEVDSAVGGTTPTLLKFETNIWKYMVEPGTPPTIFGWTRISSADTPPLSAQFGSIARYQLNKYYYVGSFDYMIRGSVEGSETQPLSGLITPLTSFEIKTFDDTLQIDHDDLIVIDGHLYSVEALTAEVKRMPKPFVIHFATLNSVL